MQLRMLPKAEKNKKYCKKQNRRYWLMRLGKYLSSLTKPELEEIKEKLNLTDDEEMVFCQLSKGRSRITTADNCGISSRTVDTKIQSISAKLKRIGGCFG